MTDALHDVSSRTSRTASARRPTWCARGYALLAALGICSLLACDITIERTCDCHESQDDHRAANAPAALDPPDGRAEVLPDRGSRATNPAAPAFRDDERAQTQPTAAAPAPSSSSPEDRSAQDVLAGLRIPVAGITAEKLRDTYADPRSGDRTHRAIDIMAPRHTQVLAAVDGTIARLWKSELGGLTVYQYGPHGEFVFYYAHLHDYESDLSEGDEVSQGDVIATVGSTGNASSDAPHLHFAIYRVDDGESWWEGEPINPYPLLSAATPQEAPAL